jgi:arsenite/tail-anchored protein-transporting ATPase
MKRIYIFTGKGGVGKTSIAAAHAIKSAEEGKRTLLLSTDMAHNLGDIFEIPFGKVPKKVMDNLDVYEIDPEYVMEHDFKDMMLSLSKLIPQGDNRALENFGMLPGMEELFALLKINEIYQEGIYDRIIVDCAPTGETLSLLKFPELLSWYMEKLFPVGKFAVKVLSPIAKQFYKVELPNKAAMNDIEKMYLRLFQLQELLKNREITSIRLVTVPEKMVVEETKRNYMYMNLYNFNVDGLYINRILPCNIDNPFFDEWLIIQKKYKEQLFESFAAIPIYEIPWYDEELRGMKAVRRICKDALTKEDIFDAKINTQRESFERNSKGYLMRISLPFVDKSKVDLYQSDNDIIIKIDNFKRNIPLPNVLRTYRVTEAKMEESILKIQFEKGDASYE